MPSNSSFDRTTANLLPSSEPPQVNNSWPMSKPVKTPRPETKRDHFFVPTTWPHAALFHTDNVANATARSGSMECRRDRLWGIPTIGGGHARHWMSMPPPSPSRPVCNGIIPGGTAARTTCQLACTARANAFARSRSSCRRYKCAD